MKKKLTIVFFAIFTILALSACQKNVSPSDASEENTEDTSSKASADGTQNGSGFKGGDYAQIQWIEIDEEMQSDGDEY